MIFKRIRAASWGQRPMAWLGSSRQSVMVRRFSDVIKTRDDTVKCKVSQMEGVGEGL